MIKKILLLDLFLLLVFMFIVLFNQQQIMKPERRTLHAYHREWLDHAQAHSMSIVRTPEHPEILIVKQNLQPPLSKRHQKIKDALLAVGYKKEALKNNGILLMYHGKNGRKEDLLPVAERYVTAGFTCVLLDLPAHGDNPEEEYRYGQGEERFLYDETLTFLQSKKEFSHQPIYLWGMSLGGAYAISSALPDEKRAFPAPKAMVLVATFDQLSHVLNEKSVDIFGIYLGKLLYKGLEVSLKFFYNFEPKTVNSATNAEQIKLPIFMLHGKKDALIAYKQGENLFKHFASKDKTLHLDEEGTHHNILVTKYPFYLESIDFLLKHKTDKH